MIEINGAQPSQRGDVASIGVIGKTYFETSAKGVASRLCLDLVHINSIVYGHRPDSTPRFARLLQRSHFVPDNSPALQGWVCRSKTN